MVRLTQNVGRRAARVASGTQRKPKAPAPPVPPEQRPRVAVLVSSYEGSAAETKSVDDYKCTPAHWTTPEFPYRFTFHEMKKATSHADLQRLASEEDVACYYNLCDGARVEDRAGEDVVRALEGMNLPFTGADSSGFEPSKVAMKMLVTNGGVKTPPFAVVERGQNIAKACRHLQFPVIIKPISGFASVGITRESKCSSMQELEVRCATFVEKYETALVEQFITGEEGTVLVCADPNSRHGIRVFPPIFLKFPGGPGDFQHYDNKWTQCSWVCDETKPRAVDINHPAYGKVIESARNAFNLVLNKVGYGRVDFRIDARTNDVYFLEINSNCGMFYPKEIGGDFADIMVEYDKDWSHNDFIRVQIELAKRHAASRTPWWNHVHNSSRQFAAKATQSVPEGTPVFGDCTKPVGVVARSAAKLGSKEKPGCIVCRADDRHAMAVLKHSCNPNLAFLHGQALELVTTRRVRKGESLSIDYATLRDTSMPEFSCRCGSPQCRQVIRPQAPMLRRSPTPLRPSKKADTSRKAEVAAKKEEAKKDDAPKAASKKDEAPKVAAKKEEAPKKAEAKKADEDKAAKKDDIKKDDKPAFTQAAPAAKKTKATA